MKMEKMMIKGKKGHTVCYSLPNFRFDSETNQLKWDAFSFYTPLGELLDEDGFRYFNVPAEELLIQRDDNLDKELVVMITKENGIEAVEILQGAIPDSINIGIEGDIVLSGFIPADTNEEIVFHYKEVTDG
jgi:hypothetical protein